ncbi:hypothetical protein FOMPIDRAFT_90086 [Fomitopsis schrenkii]|uniref:Uncharacterized protein n=1 Tax=Fomitopsis schrenkii TaxID=2126942 RepID=S8DXT4_FOMSC|nr:hypothetical protein FOMPIDRAFT_90086 [Fomitopsis schrenkii]
MAGSRLAKTPDVVSEIVQYLDPFVDDFGDEFEPITANDSDEPTIPSPANQKSLFRLACTSRTISECALDVLWNRLTTLRDLFNVFPSLQHRRVEDPTDTFHSGPIEWAFTSPDATTAADWE